MRIHARMDLDALAARMGTGTSSRAARAMRCLLLVRNYADTAEVPSGTWHLMVEAAGHAARFRAEGGHATTVRPAAAS